MLPVEQPFKTYTGLDGKPLDNGYVYFGQPNLNPITAPVTVYWDAAGTIPAAQPLRTMNGYILRSGTPANVFFDGAYSETVLDSKKRQVFYARTSDEFSIATAVKNFISSLALASGASLIGFLQSGVGAVLRTLLSKLGEHPYSITDFGASTGNAASQNGVAIQKAVDAAVLAGRRYVQVPDGTFLFDTFTPKSNITLIGPGTLKQVQPAANAQTGIRKAAGAGSLSNFHIRGVKFDGDRQANPANPYNAIISIELGTGETLDGFSVTDCDMQDAQEHFIRVIATSSTAMATRISVRGNSFITTLGKRSLGGTSTATSYDAVRCEQTWDYASSGNGYGTINLKHIVVSDNYAEAIRTLADIKRGCSHFTVSENHTKNMFDCHHSVDGSFHGEVIDNICEVESTYAGPSTFTNFIECQGEHIRIAGNIGSGGGKIVNGILVSDYGRVEESGKGHRPRHVTIGDNRIKDVTGNGLRIVNGDCCAIIDNHVENVGGHVATVESGSGYTDATGVLNIATGCRVSGNSSRNATLGVRLGGQGNVKGVNPDENGQDYLYLPGLALADTYATFINEGGYRDLNPNSLLELVPVASGGVAAANNILWFDADFYPASTTAATKPNNAANAITITDETAGVIRAAFCGVKISAVAGQRIYAKVDLKKNSSLAYGLIVQECDAAGTVLGVTFYGTNVVATNWTAYAIGHKVTNAATSYIRVGITPAAGSNDPSLSGATDAANFRIARVAIGR